MLILNFFAMIAAVSPENSYSDERGPGRDTSQSVRLSLTTRSLVVHDKCTSQNARYIPVFQRSSNRLSATGFLNLVYALMSCFHIRHSSNQPNGGSGRTRTTDLTLIRGAL